MTHMTSDIQLMTFDMFEYPNTQTEKPRRRRDERSLPTGF